MGVQKSRTSLSLKKKKLNNKKIKNKKIKIFLKKTIIFCFN